MHFITLRQGVFADFPHPFLYGRQAPKETQLFDFMNIIDIIAPELL